MSTIDRSGGAGFIPPGSEGMDAKKQAEIRKLTSQIKDLETAKASATKPYDKFKQGAELYKLKQRLIDLSGGEDYIAKMVTTVRAARDDIATYQKELRTSKEEVTQKIKDAKFFSKERRELKEEKKVLKGHIKELEHAAEELSQGQGGFILEAFKKMPKEDLRREKIARAEESVDTESSETVETPPSTPRNAETELSMCYRDLQSLIREPVIRDSLSQTTGLVGRMLGATEYNTLENLGRLPLKDLPEKADEFTSLIKKAYEQIGKPIPQDVEQKIANFEKAVEAYKKNGP